MENKKTISHLNSKMWYRAVKVLYCIFTGLCYAIALASTIGFWFFNELEIALLWIILLKVLIVPWAIFWAWLVSKIPQWIFYYIVLGEVRPKK